MNARLNLENHAVIYLRICSSHPQDAQAVDLQRRGCRKIAAKHGLQIIREYADIGVPAILERQTALLHLLEDLARQRDAAHVIMWDYSRVGNALDQLEQVERYLSNVGVGIVTLTGVEVVTRFMDR